MFLWVLFWFGVMIVVWMFDGDFAVFVCLYIYQSVSMSKIVSVHRQIWFNKFCNGVVLIWLTCIEFFTQDRHPATSAAVR